MPVPIPEIPIERFEVFASGLDHPECIAFDRDGSLWAGGEAGQIYRIDAAGKLETVATLGGFTGGHRVLAAWTTRSTSATPSLGLVRVDADGRHCRLRHRGRRAADGLPPIIRCSTGAGGSMCRIPELEDGATAALLRFEPDGTGRVIGGSVRLCQRAGVSARRAALCSWRRATPIASSGSSSMPRAISGRVEVYAEQVGRLPDGLALDEAGNLYVACYASDEIWRISPSREKTTTRLGPSRDSPEPADEPRVGRRRPRRALRGEPRAARRSPARAWPGCAGSGWRNQETDGHSHATRRPDRDRHRRGPRDRQGHRGGVRGGGGVGAAGRPGRHGR